MYDIAFERRAWSVFRVAEQIATYNPLRRLPRLARPRGGARAEGAATRAAPDDQAADERVLLPRRGPLRRAGLRVAALACGVADKGVALVYENVARESGHQSPGWVERCTRQVEGTLGLLERERAAIATRWWLGESLSHADIAVGVAVHFLVQAAPAVLERLPLPALRAHEAACHEQAPFQRIDEPLHFPA